MSEPPAPTRVTVSMLAAEPETVRDVFERLEALESSIQVATVSVHDGDRSTATIDVSPLTAKQWEALELAYQLGYYRRPRAVGLGPLAAELAISESAVSQRLRAAESRLVKAVFGTSVLES
ncbi:HTH DNA binding domain-containing protein [Natronorubrum sediminis]|uniref:HTH DNA binding domain-containing protein n=1 Tax=Natronorubrum sediminis TaxID=640943 RepID=A0A1H6FUN2_9EURY|nr:helix-turn-helix domain-containing protein [Natronorubrum sediminis]SEH14511.1 HTH DNA binding domain-containing protein [Natronorubrum sediminis]